MSSAIRARRITLGLLLASVLVTAGVCWRAPSSEDVSRPHPHRSLRVLQPQAAEPGPAKEAFKVPPDAKYRANLLLRLLPPVALATQSGDRRITDLKSPEVLSVVVQQLDLARRWSVSTDEGLSKLTAMARMVPSNESVMTGTLLVFSPDGNEAEEIADSLVSTFKSSLEKSESDQTSRLAEPVYKQIKARTDSVEQARNQMVDCMNRRQILDCGFLDALNGRPGAIQPELDAALDPGIKVAWFSHQSETLKSMANEEAIRYLAGAVLPFDHHVTKLCQTWLELAPTGAAIVAAEANAPGPGGGPATAVLFEQQKFGTDAAIDTYKTKLQEWITQTAATLPPEDPSSSFASGNEKTGQDEYLRLKQHYQAETEFLKALQENAARLFGSAAPIYVPALVVLKKSVERLPR